MDEAKVKFGDKIFVYGTMTDWNKTEDLGLIDPVYNTVMGYMPVGGYFMVPQKTDQVDACLPGFVMESTPSLALETLFSHMEMIDVTNLLSYQEPTLAGTKVWMPIP